MLNRIIVLICLLALPLFTLASAEEKPGVCVPEGKWITSKGDSYDPSSITHTLSKTKVVLLGEDHDNAEHHRWQLQTMSAIYALEPNMALGFEAFPRSTQKILDQWVAGKLSEKEFLAAVDWNKIWRFNKNDYMPMFHFARMNRIPMYALNVDRALISKVGENGWDNVPVDEREGVSKPAEPTQDYVDVLAQVFSQHIPKHAHGDDGEEGSKEEKGKEHGELAELSDAEIKEIIEMPSFQGFIQGQLLWDRAMAEILYSAIKDKGHPIIVGILGAGHIMGNYGVPHQLNSLGLKSIKTLMAWDGTIECQQLLDGAVDIAFGIVEVTPDESVMQEEKRPRLGVYLEHNEGVLITRLVEGSVAETAGIQIGDRIVKIAGKSVDKVSEVVKAVKSMAFGTWLPMTVKRDDKEIMLVAKFPALD